MKRSRGPPERDAADEAVELLRTSIGDVPLQVMRFAVGAREWSILHAGAIVTDDDEQRFLSADDDARLPYGAMLWPSSIALAQDLAARDLAGLDVLELGAGTGAPGLVAASRGARVLQTDRDEIALHLAGRNARKNGVDGIVQRRVDWVDLPADEEYDVVLAADVLYATSMHDVLRCIFARADRVLLSDPFRPGSLKCLQRMERDGWRATMSRWNVGGRAIGVYELSHF